MQKEKMNVRGTINALEVEGSVTFPRPLYVLSVVRTTAGAITSDTGKKFNVTTDGTDENIVVTRIS